MESIADSPGDTGSRPLHPAAIRINRLRCIIAAAWGVVLAKCFYLEYLVQKHYPEDPPVATAFYVWTLTLVFAAAATLVFHHIWMRESAAAAQPFGTAGRVWTGAVALIAASAAVGLATPVLDPYRIPLAAAVVLAAAFLIHGAAGGRRELLAFGAGWGVGAALLLANPGVPALGLFAGLLIVLLVLPAIVMMPKRPAAAAGDG